MTAAATAVAQAHRESWGRLLALLTRQFGNLDVAEDALQDAFAAAVTAWARDGVPERPEAWLLTAARRRAIDRVRRAETLARRLPLLVGPDPAPDPAEEVDGEMSAVPDERLRLLFACCHPALGLPARIALTLRCLGGLTTAEIARAFLVPEATMAARITGRRRRSRPPASPTGSRPVPSCPSGCRACWWCSTSCSTRATRPRPATRRCGGSCATRRSGWSGSWSR